MLVEHLEHFIVVLTITGLNQHLKKLSFFTGSKRVLFKDKCLTTTRLNQHLKKLSFFTGSKRVLFKDKCLTTTGLNQHLKNFLFSLAVKGYSSKINATKREV